ncbi:EamA family transporter [Patescibacteria group bacterium]|nr:EamA family transporter [Patescibacteria group bacterium]
MQVLLLALVSMVCAAANDFVFKLYARRHDSTGAYLAIIGVVWAGVFMGPLPSFACLLDYKTATWGIISGVFSICANILLVKLLAKEDVGICATIYRLNLVPAALLAFILFKEPVTAPRLTAIAAGVAAIWLFSWPARKSVSTFVFSPFFASKPCGLACNAMRSIAGRLPQGGSSVTDAAMEDKMAFLASQGSAKMPRGLPRGASLAIWLTVLASLLRAGMGLSYKAGLLNGANEYGLLVINGFVWIIGGIICHFVVDQKKWRIPPATAAYGALSGVLVCGIALFMMLALKYGDASLVLPVTQMSFALTALAGIVFIKEPLTSRKCLGIALAMVCILLMGVNR